MELVSWLPSITTTLVFAAVLWLGRKFVGTLVSRTVEFRFDRKLEDVRAEIREKEQSLRADLQAKEAELAVLRGGAMTAMAGRQMALDQRRLEAVDQLWSTITALGHAKNISSLIACVKFEATAELAQENPKLREVFELMGTGFDPNKIDLSGAARARPFVSPMTWALFSAYQAIIMQAVVKLEIIKSGIGAKFFADREAITKVIKAALPDQVEYIDKVGDAGYHYLLEALEERLLHEMRRTLPGVEADEASAAQAANILRLSNALLATASRIGMTPDKAP